MKKTLWFTAVLTLTTCSAIAWGQSAGNRQGGPGGPGGQGGPGMMTMTCPAMVASPPPAMMFERMTDLGLTTAQKTKLKAIETKGQKSQQALMKKSADATKALRTAMMAAKYDAKKVKSLAAAAEKAEAALVNARIDQWTQMRSVLTSAQIAKMQKAMANMGRMGRGGQGGFGGPPPDGGNGMGPGN